MALQKQPVAINFGQGLDTKTDPFQVALGKFLALTNSIFDKAGRLTKRNGYGSLTILPDESNTYLTTFNGDLTAIGTSLNAYSTANKNWVNKGQIQPISLVTLPLIRSNTNQTQLDATVAPNLLVCTVYTDQFPAGPEYKYAIADSVTGQNIVAPTLIPANGGGTITGSPRVFTLGVYFIIVFTNLIGATSHLQYLAISFNNPNGIPTFGEIASSYEASTTVSWDAVEYSNRLFIAYPTAAAGQSVQIRSLTNTLILSAARSFAGENATLMSLTVDTTNPSVPIIWAAYYNSASSTGKAFAVSYSLFVVLAPTVIIPAGAYLNLTTTAQNGVLSFYGEIDNDYTFAPFLPTHFIVFNTLTQLGVLGTSGILLRSVGLASKAFLYQGVVYMLVAYQSVYQPSYFLINQFGQVIAKLAYSNGGGYDTTGLPSVTVLGSLVYIGYLFKDLISATNKTQGLVAAQASPVYSQTGLNLVTFNMSVNTVDSNEIGGNLNLTGGFIAGYDGYTVTEQNFFVWPDDIGLTASTTGGSMSAQQYFYAVTYEWSDNAGNTFRSAPSIPVTVTTGSSTSSVIINVPTLRLTYKLANPVKIVVYRWSTALQTYYAIQPYSVPPILNNVNVDSIAILDVSSDAQILGNPILYTSGGVIEDISPPSSSIMTLFNNRLWLVDAEDTNLLWFSKQVIENTPVEMSDLLTVFIAPTTGSQGSTGPITALSPMDDKLIVFKQDALGYISGIGPDNTGSNNGYSDFTLINSVVGCSNEKSIVFTPNGLMFQSDKGMWLLGRDLSTTYIGAPVELLTTGATVQSALNIPTTNQVRFTLDTGITLVYDYFFGQWGTFMNVPAISSTIFQSLHTYINKLGQVFQETPGFYLDGSNPVLLSFTTSWINLAGLQGYQRAYYFDLLGVWLSPHFLNLGIAYDYNPAIIQETLIRPDNYSPNYGNGFNYGVGSPYGGNDQLEPWQTFLTRQRCQSFQITLNELYDASFGVVAGPGLTISGLNLIVGLKKGHYPKKFTNQAGSP
jgi:hypothetical protein